MYFLRLSSQCGAMDARANAREEAENLIKKLEDIHRWQKMNNFEGGMENPEKTALLRNHR